MATITDNMTLWELVRTPDPSRTKAFSRGGGFRGTATNVVYLVQRATEIWGPIGGAWGLTIDDERYVDGAPLIHDGAVVGKEVIHVIRIRLRHPGGEFPGIGQTTFVGKNKNGFFTDEEAPKKSLTDALSKSLSWLGFAADIHLGLWDDSKYVNDVKRRFEEAVEEEREETIGPKEIERIKTLLTETGADRETVLNWVSDKTGVPVNHESDIPLSAFAAVVKALSKKTKEAA